jgi:uncharacterized protein YjbI with pentapeptide repeats
MFAEDNFAESFHDLSLSGGEIFKKEFEDCTFSGCDFSHTTIKQSIFSDCHFKGCDFTLADLVDTKFSAVVFEECKLIGIDWSRADWSSLTQRPLRFVHSTLNSASFWGVKMPKWQITECNASEADFREADLSEADLCGTDFSKALFRNSNLTDANFSQAKNFDIDIRVNTLTGAKFSRYEAVRLLQGLGIELTE